MDNTTDEKIKEAVRQTYGDIAHRFVEGLARARCCGPSTGSGHRPSQTKACCGPSEPVVETKDTAASLYSAEELADLPDSVTDVSLGCGNPTAIAELQPARWCSTWVRVGALTVSWLPGRSARRDGSSGWI